MKTTEGFAGAGFGLFVGLLLGLSISPVVGTIIGPLAALLGAILGLTGTSSPGRAIRLGAFGLACALGVLIGVTIRSQSLLSPSIRENVERWTSAGYPAGEARALVALERLGVQPVDRTVKAAPPSRDVLFASAPAGLCTRLEALGAGDAGGVADVLLDFDVPYKTMATLLKRLPVDVARQTVPDVKKALCG